jgi:hypothetical protein
MGRIVEKRNRTKIILTIGKQNLICYDCKDLKTHSLPYNPTHLCVDRPHSVNLLLYNMLNLKALLFKVVGESD